MTKKKRVFLIEQYNSDMQRVGDEIVCSYEVGGNKVKPQTKHIQHKQEYATVAYVDKKIDDVKYEIGEIKEEIKEINLKLNKLTEKVEKLTDLFFKFIKKNNK